MSYRSPLRTQWPFDRSVVAEGGCWLWIMARDPDGYGRTSANPTGERLAHRVAWTLARGVIPDGLTIDHLCFVRACINPDHLRLMTRLENCRRQRSALSEPSPECGKGHSDFYVAPNGRRRCRICSRAAAERYRQRKREATLGGPR